MRGARSLALVLALGAAEACERAPAPARPEPPPDRPATLGCPAPVHRFGAVLQGERVRHTFHLRNEGPGRLRLEGLRAACACTSAQLLPQELAPGQGLALPVELDTRGLLGPQERRIEVLCDDPDRPALTLRLLGEVELAAAFEEEWLDLGPVGQGETATAWVGLRGRLRDSVALSGLEIAGVEGLSARSVERDGLPGLEVSLRAGRALGVLEGRVSARTGLTAPRRLSLPVRAEVVGDLRLDRPTVSFDPYDADSPPEQTVWLRSERGQAFRIRAVEDPAGAVEAEWAERVPRAAARRPRPIKLRLGRAPEAPRGELRIRSDHPDQPVLVLPYLARSYRRPAPPPPASADPSELRSSEVSHDRELPR